MESHRTYQELAVLQFQLGQVIPVCPLADAGHLGLCRSTATATSEDITLNSSAINELCTTPESNRSPVSDRSPVGRYACINTGTLYYF